MHPGPGFPTSSAGPAPWHRAVLKAKQDRNCAEAGRELDTSLAAPGPAAFPPCCHPCWAPSGLLEGPCPLSPCLPCSPGWARATCRTGLGGRPVLCSLQGLFLSLIRDILQHLWDTVCRVTSTTHPWHTAQHTRPTPWVAHPDPPPHIPTASGRSWGGLAFYPPEPQVLLQPRHREISRTWWWTVPSSQL